MNDNQINPCTKCNEGGRSVCYSCSSKAYYVNLVSKEVAMEKERQKRELASVE